MVPSPLSMPVTPLPMNCADSLPIISSPPCPSKISSPACDPPAPEPIRLIAAGLMYRDFITVGVLCRNVKLRESSGELVKDNWIYIQEPDVLVGRLQIFNNWSPAMVSDPNTIWIGLEYFCNEGDSLWNRTDADLVQLAKSELVSLGLVDLTDVSDSVVDPDAEDLPRILRRVQRFRANYRLGEYDR